MHPKLTSVIDQSIKIGIGFSGSYSMTRTICRMLADQVLHRPVTVVLPASSQFDWISEGMIDLGWVVPRMIGRWAYEGLGSWRGKPLKNLQAVARCPQDDRQMITLAPYAKLESLEQIAREKRPVRVAVRENPRVGAEPGEEWGRVANAIFRQYGFSLGHIESWGGNVWSVGTDFNSVDEEIRKKEVDLVIGEASTQPIWKNVAGHGFRFLPLSESAMAGLEKEGYERNITPAGFLPGIDRPLLSVNESDFLLMTREEADDELIYAVAKIIDQNRRRIEEGAVTVQFAYNQPLPITQLVTRSPLTGPITEQWKTGVPLHRAAERYYREARHL
jgi:TRAP-type uncharacterized transport system substrate-binding protein